MVRRSSQRSMLNAMDGCCVVEARKIVLVRRARGLAKGEVGRWTSSRPAAPVLVPGRNQLVSLNDHYYPLPG
jgi:hypothetical protein